jgi:hypothetical protein
MVYHQGNTQDSDRAPSEPALVITHMCHPAWRMDVEPQKIV